MKIRDALWRFIGGVSEVIGYGCLIAFLYLVGVRVYRWFREGEWTHIGAGDGLRSGLVHCCVKDGDTGRIAAFMHWLDAPVDWLCYYWVFGGRTRVAGLVRSEHRGAVFVCAGIASTSRKRMREGEYSKGGDDDSVAAAPKTLEGVFLPPAGPILLAILGAFPDQAPPVLCAQC